MGSLSEEEQLQTALQLSLAEAAVHASDRPQLWGEFRLMRGEAALDELSRTGGPLPAEADLYGVPGVAAPPGKLLQINTLNQFNTQIFGPSTEEFLSPSSPCGLFVMAHLVLVPTLLAARGWENGGSSAAAPGAPPQLRRADFDALLSVEGGLRDPVVVLPALREAMRWLHDKRKAWVEGHLADFAKEVDRKTYMRAWVANYEISDWMHERAPASSAVHFVRYNQWPEHSDATHEESLRIATDEKAYGGVRDEKLRVHFAKGEASFWVDSVEGDGGGGAALRQRSKRLAADWQAFRRADVVASRRGPCMFPVDLNGHFVFCLSCRLEEPSSGGDESTLIVINTTDANYLQWPALTRTFDLAFLDTQLH